MSRVPTMEEVGISKACMQKVMINSPMTSTEAMEPMNSGVVSFGFSGCCTTSFSFANLGPILMRRSRGTGMESAACANLVHDARCGRQLKSLSSGAHVCRSQRVWVASSFAPSLQPLQCLLCRHLAGSFLGVSAALGCELRLIAGIAYLHPHGEALAVRRALFAYGLILRLGTAAGAQHLLQARFVVRGEHNARVRGEPVEFRFKDVENNEGVGRHDPPVQINRRQQRLHGVGEQGAFAPA